MTDKTESLQKCKLRSQTVSQIDGRQAGSFCIMAPESESKGDMNMLKLWKSRKRMPKEKEKTFSDWLAELLTEEQTLSKMACSMTAFLEGENTDVPFCM